MKPTGEQAVGDDITGTSDAIVMASAPDVALPLETESAGDSGISEGQIDTRGELMQPKPLAIVAAAGACGLLLGVTLKKSLPAVKGRC